MILLLILLSFAFSPFSLLAFSPFSLSSVSLLDSSPVSLFAFYSTIVSFPALIHSLIPPLRLRTV